MWYSPETKEVMTDYKLRQMAYPATLPKKITSNSVAHLNVHRYHSSPKPDVDIDKKIEGARVEFIDGKWQQVWDVVDKFQDISGGDTKEEQAEKARQEHQKRKQEQFKLDCDAVVAKYIQDKIDDYNSENTLSIPNIYVCEALSRTNGYAHIAFCSAIWVWYVQVLESVNNLLLDCFAGNIKIKNPDDLITQLPDFTFQSVN